MPAKGKGVPKTHEDEARRGNIHQEASKDKITYGQGATRGAGAPRYSLIPAEALEAEAERFELGEREHGSHNWKLGMPIDVIIDHLEAHLTAFKLGRPDHHTGDHKGNLAAIRWASAALLWYLVHYPEKIEIFQNESLDINID